MLDLTQTLEVLHRLPFGFWNAAFMYNKLMLPGNPVMTYNFTIFFTALTQLTLLQWFRILLPSSRNILWNRQTHIPQLRDVAPLHLPTAELNNKKHFHSRCLCVTWLINFFWVRNVRLEMPCFSALRCKRRKNAAGARRGKYNRYKRLKNATSIKARNTTNSTVMPSAK